MADFNYFLNRQGPRGMQGEKGEKGNDGATPTFYAGVDSGTQYTLIIDMGDGNTFETSNLMPTFVNTGGTYLRYDTENNRYVSAQADMADLQGNVGEVKLATTTSVANETVSDGDAVSYELFRQSGGGGGGTSFVPGTGLELTGANVLNVKIDNSTITTNLAGQLVANGGGGTTYTAADPIYIDNGVFKLYYDSAKGLALNGQSLAVRVDNSTIGFDTSGQLTLKSTIPAAQIQSDWTQADNTKVDYIKNKPTIGAGVITFTQGATVLGTIDVNQTTATTINIPSSGGGGGGGSYAAGNGIDISSNDVISAKVDGTSIGTNALGELEFINNAGYITGITSGDVTTALGYTPYSSANPDGYTSNVGTVTSVNNTSPDGSGNVTLSIPAAQVQADWDEADSSSKAYILNKPTIPDTTHMVTDNTAQTISAKKTFADDIVLNGTKCIYYKNSMNNECIMLGKVSSNVQGFGHINVGYVQDALKLVGKNARPTYTPNGGTETNIALSSDIPGDMTGADGANAGTHGLVPAPTATDNTKFLKGDGTWATPTDTTYSDMTGAGASTAGAHGLVPAPAAGDNEKFLRGDGTWQAVSGGTSTDVQIDGTSITDNGVANIVTNNPVSYANVSSVIYQNKNDQKPNGIIYSSYGYLQVALGGTGNYYMSNGDNDVTSAMADSSIMYAEVALNNGINIAGYLGSYARDDSTRYVYALGKYINGDFFPIAWISEDSGNLRLTFYSSTIAGTTSENPAVSASATTRTNPTYFSLRQDGSSSATLAWCDETTGQKTSVQTFNSSNGAILATCTHVRIFPVKKSYYSSSDCTFENDLKLINPTTNVTNGDATDRMTLITNSPNMLETSYALTLLYDNTTLGVNGSHKLYAKDQLPSQTGNSGKFLTTDGSSVSWATVSSGSSTDVQINGTSITASNVANIVTEGTYNSSSNKIATMSDVPGTMVGATNSTNGTAGVVPQPLAGDEEKVLAGDGAWKTTTTIHCVIETGTSGSSWYRRYDDGWVEQGGSFAATFTAGSVVNNNVSFVVPILVSSSPYSITYSLENRTNMESSEAGIDFSNITTSQFILVTYQTSGEASSTPTCVWEAKGFEAVI